MLILCLVVQLRWFTYLLDETFNDCDSALKRKQLFKIDIMFCKVPFDLLDPRIDLQGGSVLIKRLRWLDTHSLCVTNRVKRLEVRGLAKYVGDF